MASVHATSRTCADQSCTPLAQPVATPGTDSERLPSWWRLGFREGNTVRQGDIEKITNRGLTVVDTVVSGKHAALQRPLPPGRYYWELRHRQTTVHLDWFFVVD